MGQFDNLKWNTTPTEPGWHFAWMGLGGMQVYKIIPQLMKDQFTVVGGKDDGAKMIPVEEFGARLWAGPIPVDPHAVPAAELLPPILPESEYYLLEELKKRDSKRE